MAENAQSLLDRVIEQAVANDGGNAPPDDVAAVAVRRAE